MGITRWSSLDWRIWWRQCARYTSYPLPSPLSAQSSAPFYEYLKGFSLVLSLISARTYKDGGFCLKTGASQRGKSSFSLKRVWWPISLIFFLSLEWIETYSQWRKGKIVGNVFKACTRKYSHIGILRNSAEYIQVGAAPRRVSGPLNFFLKL